jgi:hypothetical protein
VKISLATTQADYEELALALAKSRRRAAAITVPRAAFAHLVIDHSRLLEAASSRVTVQRHNPTGGSSPCVEAS